MRFAGNAAATGDPNRVAAQMTGSERAALLSLPARDIGNLPEDLWWAYSSILDQSLAMSTGSSVIIATPLGNAVLELLSNMTTHQQDNP
jgi:hypothetical protein